MKKYYVTMTDKFLSGWGEARGRIAKYVYICDSYEDAVIVEQNAINRGDQKHINIRTTCPSYSSLTHLVQWKTKKDSANWYEAGYFKK